MVLGAGGAAEGSLCGSRNMLLRYARFGVNIGVNKVVAIKTRTSVTYSTNTMHGMHRFEHRERQQATAVARAYLLVHYC